MKKIISILCICLLLAGLTACGSPRNLDNYTVEQYTDHWSVVYREDESIEEIVELGSQAQPLVIVKGRIYFVTAGAVVSVDLDGKDRKELSVPQLALGGWIAGMDEENVYCVSSAHTLTCYQVDLGMSAATEMTLPRSIRTVDYDALEKAIAEAVAPAEGGIRVQSGRVEMDANGTPVAMTLQIVSDGGEINDMAFWNTGTVSVSLPIRDVQASYVDDHVPLQVSEDTIHGMPLADFLAAVKAADSAQLALEHRQGTPEGFVLAYADELFDPDQAEGWYTVSGGEAQAGEPAFILAQKCTEDAVVSEPDGSQWNHLLGLRTEG